MSEKATQRRFQNATSPTCHAWLSHKQKFRNEKVLLVVLFVCPIAPKAGWDQSTHTFRRAVHVLVPAGGNSEWSSTELHKLSWKMACKSWVLLWPDRSWQARDFDYTCKEQLVDLFHSLDRLQRDKIYANCKSVDGRGDAVMFGPGSWEVGDEILRLRFGVASRELKEYCSKPSSLIVPSLFSWILEHFLLYFSCPFLLLNQWKADGRLAIFVKLEL